MKIVIHDYPGHAFPVQLSRQLARQGHDVWHVWSADIEAPRGPLSRQPGDPDNFHLCPISLGRPLPKYNLVKRFFAERSYARAFCRMAAAWEPDVLLSNPSPFIQGPLLRWSRRHRVQFISWLQDIYYLPIRDVLKRKFGPFAPVVTQAIKMYEMHILRRSDHVIVIADAFREFLLRQKIDPARITVIPNWAILEDVPLLPKENGWAQQKGVSDSFVYLYAGTLGLKHNPRILADLAQNQPDAKVIVISQGLGREFLEKEVRKNGLSNLILMDYQPFEQLPDVLAAADVLVALLEPSAGGFSVPSKILNYFCAGRPVLGAIPLENAAARSIVEAGAGLVVAPDDTDGFLAAAQRLRAEAKQVSMGHSGRVYAEKMFDIERICGHFSDLFRPAQAAE